MKKYIQIVSLIIAVGVVVFFWVTDKPAKESEQLIISETIPEKDSLIASQQELRDVVDSLRPLAIAAANQLKYYEGLKKTYNKRLIEVSADMVAADTITYVSEVIDLRDKLARANREIDRLKGQLWTYQRQKKDEAPALDKVEVVKSPDESAIVVTIDGKTKKGELEVPSNLTVYLIPYTKKAKRFMQYEPYCNEELSGVDGNRVADYYQGLYYFNNVEPGKYLIKICTYYGDYKVVTKDSGKYVVSMQMAPPLQ